MRSFLVCSVLLGCAAGGDPFVDDPQGLSSDFRYSFAPVATLPGSFADGLVASPSPGGVVLWGTLLGVSEWDGSAFTSLSSPPDRTSRGVLDPLHHVTYLLRTWQATQGNLYGVPDGTYVDQLVPVTAASTLPAASAVRPSKFGGLYWDAYRQRVCRIHAAGVDCLDGTAWLNVTTSGAATDVVTYDEYRKKLIVLDQYPTVRELDSATNTWRTIDGTIANRSAAGQPRTCNAAVYDSTHHRAIAFCRLSGPAGTPRIVEWDGTHARDGALAISTGSAGIKHISYEPASDSFVFTYGGKIFRGSRLAVTVTNAPPTLQKTTFDVYATEAMQLTLAPVDPDGDAVTITLVQAPAGVTLVGNTLRWSPAVSAQGAQPVKLRLDDGTATVDVTVTINVIANQYPGLPSTIDRTVTIGMPGTTSFEGATRSVSASATCQLKGTNPGVIRASCSVSSPFCSQWSEISHCAQVAAASWSIQAVVSSSLVFGQSVDSGTCASCTWWAGDLHISIQPAAGRVCGDQHYEREVSDPPILAVASTTANGCATW